MIRIETDADLADPFGGQTEFEVAVWLDDDIIGAGHTVAEAVAEARQTLRDWRHPRTAPDGALESDAADWIDEYTDESEDA